MQPWLTCSEAFANAVNPLTELSPLCKEQLAAAKRGLASVRPSVHREQVKAAEGSRVYSHTVSSEPLARGSNRIMQSVSFTRLWAIKDGNRDIWRERALSRFLVGWRSAEAAAARKATVCSLGKAFRVLAFSRMSQVMECKPWPAMSRRKWKK